MSDATNTDRAQLAELSTSAKAYLVTLETMRALVEQLHTERDQARAELEETRTMLERLLRRERIRRFRAKRGRA
jgi:multidrug resistance efflux pump